MKMFVRSVGLTIARLIGSTIVDYQSGKKLGRGLFVVWRGQIHLIGLDAVVRPVFLPQTRMTYWKQVIGFTTHPAPDFPRVPNEQRINSSR